MGHILRGNGLDKDYLLGMIDEKTARRRQKLKFMGEIRDMTERETVVDVLWLAEDRIVWRSVAAYVNLDTAFR